MIRASLADRVFRSVEEVLITDVVLAEAAWTLVGRKYRLSVRGLVDAIERLFGEPNVCFEDDQAVWRAVQAYRNATATGSSSTGQMGFADALIVAKAQSVASAADETLNGVYTFDKAMRQLPGVVSP